MTKRTPRSGFTLIELLIVIALIAIISGISVGIYNSVTQKAAVIASMATQKELVNEVSAYMQMHNDRLPDGFDSLIRADYGAAGGSYATLGTYTVVNDPGSPYNLDVSADLSLFIAQPVTNSAAETQNINRGVHPDAYTGQSRVLTVKKLTADDVTLLSALGVKTLYDINGADLFNGVARTTKRPIAPGAPICIIDPQGIAGQRLYADLGVDLSNPTAFPLKGSQTGGSSWDDSKELSTAGRTSALKNTMFYVVALGSNSKMIGDGSAGLKEAPVSGVVVKGYYNRFSVVIKKGMLNTDRAGNFAGILDPKGNGSSAARQAVNAIK